MYSDLSLEQLQAACARAIPGAEQVSLLESLQGALPDLQFSVILSRGGWYRTGGVVSADGARVAEHLAEWLSQETSNGIGDFLAKYADAGYRVTRLNGCTHYLVAALGDAPGDYLQLEVEEVQEVLERPLVDPLGVAETIQDILEPEELTPLEPSPLGGPRYLCRRLTHIGDFVARMARESEGTHPMQRMFADWQRSSAGETGHFCQSWVIHLREYTDPYGEPVMQAKPSPVYAGELPQLDPSADIRGVTLANYIHGFDRFVGYPMAWYFFMLCRKKVSPRMAEAIHNDLQGAYDYLPVRDIKILNDWFSDPYSV